MKKTYNLEDKRQKAIMVQVTLNNKKQDVELVFDELKSLITADNIDVVGRLHQNRNVPDTATFIGEGKLEELKTMVDENEVDVVVFHNNLSGSRLRNLEEKLGVRVIDRTMLILDIFAQRATSKEGKLQVELAQLEYTLPILSGLKGSFGRFGGGVGMRGPGETKLELDKRIIKDKIDEKRRELKKVEENRQTRRKQRLQSGKKKVSIVGYTNSGKSTLLNNMTKAGVYVENMLFATLDTTTRNLWLGPKKEILLTDTVGFVSDLPHNLVEAFKSTLQEATDADLLIHVVDVSDENYIDKIKIVNEVLDQLNLYVDIPIILCFNKIDLAKDFVLPDELKGNQNVICISAKNNINIEKLKNRISEILFKDVPDEY